jgi:predicted RNA-binding protein with PIN domain
MALLIDAYNVLFASPSLPDRYDTGSAAAFCRALDRVRRGRVVVVADGSPKPDDRANMETGGVELRFAGKGREADDVIEELIEAEADPRNLILVSSDHRLQRAAQRRGASYMDADVFLRDLAAALRVRDSPRATAEKPLNMPDAAAWMKLFKIDDEHGPSAADVDGEATRWLKEFGFEPEDD